MQKNWTEFFTILFVFVASSVWSQPVNDDCNGATTLNNNTSCSSVRGTLNGATNSNIPGFSCAGSGIPNDDVWYQFTATASFANIDISNISGSSGSNLSFVIYSGTCNALGTAVYCSGNTPNSGTFSVTPGQQYFVQVYSDDGAVQNWTYDICATAYTSPCGNASNNDYCSAPAVMTEGAGTFSSSTYGSYTPDLPGDFNTTFCTSNSSITVENNSWYTFTASGNSATFNFNVTNCNSFYGIQAQVFQVTKDANGCCIGFTSVSDCEDGSGEGSFSLVANGLTAGQQYVLAVDGYEGSNCDFTITNWAATGVLSVQLTDFYGIGFPYKNKIMWRTKSETECKYFELQRSFDGELFIRVAKIIGHGTTNFEHRYEYDDDNIRAGKVYYRLKQVDFNGVVQMSEPILLKRSAQGSGIVSIYPNPTTNQITVALNNRQHNNTATTAQIWITSVDGKTITIKKVNVNEFKKVRFDVSLLEKGMYFIHYKNLTNSIIITKPFVKL